jgi:hypothetical protein
MNKAIIELTKEVHSLKEKNKSSNNQRRESFSPEPEGGYQRRTRTFLEDMTDDQYKSFHVSIK